METYENLAAFIIENVGGKDNIKSVTHCLTRLRFDLVDNEKINDGALAENKEVVTTQFAGGKYQVVIGTQVGDVHQEIERQLGGPLDTTTAPEEKGSLLDRFTSIITQVMTPILNVLCGCGIIAGLMAILVAAGVLGTEDGAYLVLNAMGNACLTFFPVLLGFTSARAFGMDPFVGMIIGAVLMFPGLSESMSSGDPLFTILGGTPLAMPVYHTFFGIPIMFPSSGYTSTVIPIIFATFIASKIEKIVHNALPKAARAFLTPAITVLVAGTIALLIVGPVSVILTNLISMGISFLLGVMPIVAYIVFALVYQPLVILGLHWALISVGLIEFAASGSTLLIGLIFPASFAHLAVCAAVMLRSKSERMRETSLAAVISACFCIIEPSIYGVTLPVKKRFGICMLSGTIGAIVIGLTNSNMYAIAMGVTGLASFINPTTGDMSGLFTCLLGVGITMVIAFAVTWITYRPSDDGDPEANTTSGDASTASRHNRVTIGSPVTGEVKELSAMSDPAFSGGAMGAGVCIVPSEGRVVAPCDGVVSSLFPTGHAIGIRGTSGIEVIVHVGVDTVRLPEGTFSKHVEQGVSVRRGDVLVTFNPQQITAAGCSLETAVIVSNSDDYLEILPISNETVNAGDDLLVAITPETSVAAPSAA